ncbi:hypothetical protein DSM106972_038190 [Dulcicalothrix desertica PCC 7102]|uniref:Uncharacterized protein n=1 Tax=Dulcicalothrix desertica PCC 7102 TaxID=232991 RepID=A0A433VFY3_9CYAN|nr:hypothetical protein [Dulcicalothrix desertica]RUT04998.1 hypothetical protein DSM106972_038190 [Dulcicalothrix desertica PCC 7102]TWH43438.1 hypothetical protein CAL7102_07159 [Dulcicalothrix desertica PCC 7102]
MHELSQSVLKRHLQVKIQAQPPLFPWETELTDYPDYSDTSSMMWVRNEECSIKELFKFRSLHPKQTFKTSPSIYQNFIGFYVLLTIKLASKLEILLLKNTCNTEVIHSLVMKTLHWIVSSGKYFLLLLLLMVLPASSLNYPSISAPRVYLTYLNSVVFGRGGLSEVKVPVMMVASSDDVVTPALYEQIQPFSSINTQKYLVVLGGTSHFSVIGDGQRSIESTRELVGDNPETARNYMNILTTPFFQTYLTDKTKSARYLNAAYAKAISNLGRRLILIKSPMTDR